MLANAHIWQRTYRLPCWPKKISSGLLILITITIIRKIVSESKEERNIGKEKVFPYWVNKQTEDMRTKFSKVELGQATTTLSKIRIHQMCIYKTN